MNERIRSYVESLFVQAPPSRRAQELKEELIANLSDRYNDLVSQGKDEETAYSATIAGIGDVDELIRGLHGQEVFDPVQLQMQRQKSALLISVSIAIYILSFIFPTIFMNMDMGGTYSMIISNVLMIICWAAATMLLVYNALSRPKYVKSEDTLVEEFKEWKCEKEKKGAVQKAVISMVPIFVVIIYLILGFFFDAWHPGWMVFLLIPVIIQIIRLIGIYKGE